MKFNFKNSGFSIKMLTCLMVGVVMTSCFGIESDLEKQMKIDDQIISKYLADNGIQAQRHSLGFYYIQTPQITLHQNNASATNASATNASAQNAAIYYPGYGTQLKQNDIVNFYYTISLLNGTVVETNTGEGGVPAKFRLLTQTIIPEGLDLGINMMKVGESYRFYMPSYLAYGTYSCEHFPAFSNFIIDIMVTGVETPTQIDDAQRDTIENYVAARYQDYIMFPSGLCYIDSIPGNGIKPFTGDRVVIDFKRKYLDNKEIKSTEGVQFLIGNGQAVEGLEEGLKQMKEGGVSILFMPASIAFKQSICIIPEKARKELLEDQLITSEVLPYSIVKYIVKLRLVN